MAFNIFVRRRGVKSDEIEHQAQVAGMDGFGAPLRIVYGFRELPPRDNAAQYAYLTYLSPRWSPIGGGIPNKRDIGCAPPAYSKQGVLVAQVGSPGILAGAFVSGPLTNTTTQQSNMAVPNTGSFQLPTL
jgi:hypothetical protein